MTIDERLEKLTERHEALSLSVELHQHQLDQQTENVNIIASAVAKMLTMVQIHEQRIERLEDPPL